MLLNFENDSMFLSKLFQGTLQDCYNTEIYSVENGIKIY